MMLVMVVELMEGDGMCLAKECVELEEMCRVKFPEWGRCGGRGWKRWLGWTVSNVHDKIVEKAH